MTINKFECSNVCVSKDQNTTTLTRNLQTDLNVSFLIFLKFGFVLTHYQVKIKFERHTIAAKGYDLL